MGQTFIKDYRKEISRIVDTIASQYKPEKIIMFGSAARGRFGQNSDLDLLVIKKTNQRYLDRVREIALILDTWLPTDIFVVTPEEVERAIAQNRFFFVDEILPKGKVVYEKTQVRS